MKLFLGLGVVVMLGVGLGVVLADIKMGDLWWTPEAGEPVEQAAPSRDAGQPMPKLAIDQTEYNFGTLDMNSGGQHDFVFSNEGDAPLKLIAGGTSCRCTTSEFDEKEIAPGDSDAITISWRPAERIGPYQQTARILTNDPDHSEVTLTIAGEISATVQVYPAELIFSNVLSNEPATGEVQLLCYLDDEFEILGHQWSNAETAEYFYLSLSPLTPERLAQWPGVKSGYAATIAIKPGLPQGAFKQKLTFKTNLTETPQMVLPIEGIVGSEIAVAGPGWDADRGILTIGAVPGSEGAERRLMLVVRGPHRHEVSFKPVDVFPSSMQVILGQRREINQGAVVQTPLLIEIPPGSPTVNCLGSDVGKLGEIVLETTHPQVPRLRILVKLAIEK